MRVVLDANVFISGRWGQSVAFSSLRKSALRVGLKVAIPLVVWDELLNKFDQEWSQLQNEYDRLRQSSILPVGTSLSPLPLSAEAARSGFETRLKAIAGDVAAELIPYPSIPHADLAQREMRGRAPLHAKKSGYRDALIWYSVLDLLKRGDGAIGFVTENKHDFCGDGGLHPDLRDDLRTLGRGGDDIQIYRSLQDLVAERVTPVLEHLKGVQQQLQEGTFQGLDIGALLVDVDGLLSGRVVDPRDIGLPWDLYPLSINLGEEVVRLQIEDVRRFPDGDLLIVANADVECVFDFRWGEDIAEELDPELREQVYVNGPSASLDLTLYVGLVVSYSPAKKAVNAADIVDLRRPWEVPARG